MSKSFDDEVILWSVLFMLDKVMLPKIKAVAKNNKMMKSKSNKTKIQEIRLALQEYYGKLDTRQNGHVAASQFLESVETILEMEWKPGATLEHRNQPKNNIIS